MNKKGEEEFAFGHIGNVILILLGLLAMFGIIYALAKFILS